MNIKTPLALGCMLELTRKSFLTMHRSAPESRHHIVNGTECCFIPITNQQLSPIIQTSFRMHNCTFTDARQQDNLLLLHQSTMCVLHSFHLQLRACMQKLFGLFKFRETEEWCLVIQWTVMSYFTSMVVCMYLNMRTYKKGRETTQNGGRKVVKRSAMPAARGSVALSVVHRFGSDWNINNNYCAIIHGSSLLTLVSSWLRL